MTSFQPSLLRGGGGGGRSGPSSSSSATHRSRHDEPQLPEAYQQERPPWRPPLHPAAADRDVPDLFPTKPNQQEDDMSQFRVRKGFDSRPYVRNETSFAHEMIYTRLASSDTIATLSSWMDEVMLRRRELDRAGVAPSQYKAPSRVTLNEVKLANYVKDLADPSVPLNRLSRSVPHGFRGEKLFEMLWAGGALPSATSANIANNNYFPHRVPNASTASTPSVSAPASAAAAARKSVDISRAVWFIRALGAAELSSLRNKSAATIVPEITSNLCTWMARQVAELNLVQAAESSSTAAASPAPVSPSTHMPRTPGAGPASLSRSIAAVHFTRTPSNLNPASSPSPAPAKEVCSVLQSEVDEERWVAKWSYSLSLARHLHAQNLLDRSVLVRWIVDAFAASNLVQLPFMVELIQEVLVFILRRRSFVRPFIAALLVQVPTLDARLDPTTSGGLRTKLVLLFRIVCENIPDALISPRLWSEHSATLLQLLNEIGADSESLPSFATTSFVEQALKPRVDRLLIHSPSGDSSNSGNTDTQPTASPTLQQHLDIRALDSFSMTTIDRIFLQKPHGADRHTKHDRDDAIWAPRVDTILTWACTDRRSGVARQYLAATLLEKIRFGVSWEESSEETDQVSLPAFDLEHHTKKTRKINIEPMLIKWLGDIESALIHNLDETETQSRTCLLATVDVAAIVVLVGELARRGVFSYTKYLQRLIARGMTTASSTGSTKQRVGGDTAASTTSSNASASRDSLHLRLLRSLPLYDQPASVYLQRRQAIYGDRTKETYEDAAQRRALRQLQSFLPFAFADQGHAATDGQVALDVPSQPVEGQSRDLEQSLSRLWSASRFVRCKIFRSELLPALTARVEALNGEQLSQVSAVFVMADDFEGLAQLLATLLLRPLSDSLARAAFNMVIEHSLVWRSMDIMGTLNQLVRQQLNHSSSIRNDRQAVMASTTLLRLRTLIEGIPSRISAPSFDPGTEYDAVHQHVQALRPNVDALLRRFAKLIESSAESREGTASTPAEGSDMLTPFRSLFIQPDATSDEIIERTIVESVLASSDASLVSAAVRLIDQLYLEASLEIDERHARWLSHLVHSIEHGTHSDTSVKVLLLLLTRLVAHGTLNLQLAMDTFLLPYLLSSVRRLTDPATRGTETSLHLGAAVSSLGEIFASSVGETVPAPCYEDMRAFGAQAMLLFAQVNLPSLLRAVTCLICASDEASIVDAADKAQIEAFWKALLQSQPMQIAFRQDPRMCMLTIKDTCKSMWGCNPSRIIDLAMACLDPTSLLLREVTSIDAAAVKARLDGWDTAVVANELVEIFERLQLVESSFQSRADSRTKALASGIFDDLFVRLPDIGAQLMRDCQSSGLISRFTDIGIKILSDKVKASADADADAAKRGEQLDVPKNDACLDGQGNAKLGADKAASSKMSGSADSAAAAAAAAADAAAESTKSPREQEVESTMRSVLRMCEQQASFIFNATDADSCGQLLLHVVTSLEEALGSVNVSARDDPARLSSLLHRGLTFQLLHLVMRFGCLWNGSIKSVALRLVKALLELTRQAGEGADCGAHFTLLLDSLSFVLDELPPQFLGACLPELETQLQVMELATQERTDKLQQLSFRLDNATTVSGWFVASSAGAALKRGWYTPGGLNPWECAEYLDAPPAGSAAGGPGGAATGVGGNIVRVGPVQARTTAANARGGGATAGVQSAAAAPTGSETSTLPGARTGWTSKLSLNTAFPLSMLGLRVTRDLVPQYASPASPSAASVTSNDASSVTSGHPTATSASAANAASSDATASTERDEAMSSLPIFVESERTYGSRMAGEPAFSRDLRRGLLLQPVLPPQRVDGSQDDVAAVNGGAGSGGGMQSRMTGASSDAIPVIDLTWDDDEVMSSSQHQPSSSQQGRQQQQQQAGGSAPVAGTAAGTTSRKRRMSKRD
ncbi:hypothetical protein EX895_004504 [Sporisorium graminicola]|uniref:Mediator of RNA polymerase II transcription subunit 12 n=1 Tax=Sporisorium graminicola TaxID=280036 RepID=A0A4U7KPF3_9BASI|nr:hypothetical protein EX895_004504 [Sporisorium graminicola]TKY86355.1 hypothetical protein EX895_004504 [Sporisorium graminicola]